MPKDPRSNPVTPDQAFSERDVPEAMQWIPGYLGEAFRRCEGRALPVDPDGHLRGLLLRRDFAVAFPLGASA